MFSGAIEMSGLWSSWPETEMTYLIEIKQDTEDIFDNVDGTCLPHIAQMLKTRVQQEKKNKSVDPLMWIWPQVFIHIIMNILIWQRSWKEP